MFIFGKLKMKIANFPGKFTWKIPSELQHRTLHIPWLQKKYVISCEKDRTFSSSGPVRYIPKQSSNIEESCRPLTLKDLEVKEIGNCSDSKSLRLEVSHGVKNVQRSTVLRDRDRENVQNQMLTKNSKFDDAKPDLKEQIDHNLGLMDFEFTDEPEEDSEELEICEGKDFQERNVPQAAGKTRHDVEKSAVELLAIRAFTAVELGKKLQGKRFPHDIIEAVIIDFQERGLINDCLYAESFSRSRWSSSSWGPRRIKQALVKKGVSAADAENALQLVFQDGESGEDQESRLGLSKVSMDHLFVQASKQWLRGRDIPQEKRKSRIIRWLQYRGFNWGVISFIVKKLESQDTP